MVRIADDNSLRSEGKNYGRIGVEVELLAPPLVSRRRLAYEIAAACGGTVDTSWHVGMDETKHSEFGRFRHLAPAFDVFDGAGAAVARIVDDVTIVTDLNSSAAPARNWRRVVASDVRWLYRLRPLLSPLGELEAGTEAAAAELGLTLEHRDAAEQQGADVHFLDAAGDLVALLGGVPGERFRVAECISPPLSEGVQDWFELLAGAARSLGFLLPAEGATHLHYDAEQFRDPAVFRRLVTTFVGDLAPLRERFATNMLCSRLGALDPSLLEIVSDPDYDSLSWAEIAERSRATRKLTKYCDVNLQHLLARVPKIDTVEFRMLPSTLDPGHFANMLSGVDELVNSIVAPDLS